ncbi:MAG: hypothetical protein ACK4SA_10520 [Caldilinea sp.]
MTNAYPSFWVLTFKTIVAHTLTYFLVGLAAFTVLNYTEFYARPEVATYMRQTSDPMVALGPALQPIRGVLFALVFYVLREPLFGRKRGWLIIWLMLVVLGIFSTFGPAPASVEGLIYLKAPVQEQLSGGLLEVLTQSLLFSALLFYWVNHPERRWLTWVLGMMFVLVISMSIMGFFMA